MASYVAEIQSVINDALGDLAQAHSSKRVANTPIGNTNFLARWLTNSIKQQRYTKQVAGDLIGWQKYARSKGSASDLFGEFSKIKAFYDKTLPDLNSPTPVTDAQIEALLDSLEELNWSRATDTVIDSKIQVFTEGDSSIVLCANECDNWFEAIEGSDKERLTKPMRVFVRGDHQQFITAALAQGLLVHKQSDYKSVVKYHGLYWVYPENCGQTRPEIPFSFQYK